MMGYSEKELKEEQVSRRDIFSGHIFRVHVDQVRLPDGAASSREIVDHNGGVCVAAVNGKGEIALVRQFRYAYGRVITELPAGKLEKSEDPDDAIRRELREEIGAYGENWHSMGRLYPSPGYVNEVIHLYSCDICGDIGDQRLDEDEFLNVEFVPLEKAAEMVLCGEIEDSKSQVLILKCAIERGIYRKN